MPARILGKRKRKLEDEDVIKTEPDKKRATGKPDDDEFEEDEEAPFQLSPVRGLTSLRDILDRKHALRKIHRRQQETDFPFLKLPAEIRNMIYRYLVVSQAEDLGNYRCGPQPNPKVPIDLTVPECLRKLWTRGGIETSILCVNRQVRYLIELNF